MSGSDEGHARQPRDLRWLKRHPSGIKDGNDAIVVTLADAGIRFAPATELSIVPHPYATTTGDPSSFGEDR
jgi:hypothetical protein